MAASACASLFMRSLKWPDRRSLGIDGYRFRLSQVRDDDYASIRMMDVRFASDEMKNEVREHREDKAYALSV